MAWKMQLIAYLIIGPSIALDMDREEREVVRMFDENDARMPLIPTRGQWPSHLMTTGSTRC